VFAAGWSAGAHISSSIAYFDLESEKPSQTFELPPLTSGQNTILRPNLGFTQKVRNAVDARNRH
jgi:hypothetical protein